MDRKSFFIQDEQGNILPGAECVLIDALTGEPAQNAYSDEGPLTVPFFADDNGFVNFYVLAGQYELQVSSGARTFSLPFEVRTYLGQHIGDIATGIHSPVYWPDDSWRLADGAVLKRDEYPELASNLIDWNTGASLNDGPDRASSVANPFGVDEYDHSTRGPAGSFVFWGTEGAHVGTLSTLDPATWTVGRVDTVAPVTHVLYDEAQDSNIVAYRGGQISVGFSTAQTPAWGITPHPDSPTYLARAGSRLYALTTDGSREGAANISVCYSTDGGATWQLFGTYEVTSARVAVFGARGPDEDTVFIYFITDGAGIYYTSADAPSWQYLQLPNINYVEATKKIGPNWIVFPAADEYTTAPVGGDPVVSASVNGEMQTILVSLEPLAWGSAAYRVLSGHHAALKEATSRLKLDGAVHALSDIQLEGIATGADKAYYQYSLRGYNFNRTAIVETRLPNVFNANPVPIKIMLTNSVLWWDDPLNLHHPGTLSISDDGRVFGLHSSSSATVTDVSRLRHGLDVETEFALPTIEPAPGVRAYIKVKG